MSKKSGEIMAVKKMIKKFLFLQEEIIHVKTERDLMVKSSSDWLVKLHHAFQDDDCIYLAMEYVPGGDFRNFLCRHGILSEDQTRFYCCQMFMAIDQVHKMGFIHRDVKPENFLITEQGYLKLTDFGLSHGMSRSSSNPKICLDMNKLNLFPKDCRDYEKRLNIYRAYNRYEHRAHSLVGSPDYIAIEIISDSDTGYDYAVDYWSIGCMIYECMIGYPPFASANIDNVWQNVKNWEKVLKRPIFNNYELQGCLNDTAWDLISLLITHRKDRLDSLLCVQNHKFFLGFAFGAIFKMEAPFIPKLAFPTDTRHFDDFSCKKNLELYSEVLEKHKALQYSNQDARKIEFRCHYIDFDYNYRE